MKLVILLSMVLTIAIKSKASEVITSSDIESVITEQTQTHTVIVASLDLNKVEVK